MRMSSFRGTPAERRALGAYVKLRRALAAVDAALATRLAEAELTETQFGVLEALLHLGPQAQCDLAARVLVTAGNMTFVVDKLEKRGLVRRARGEDRRVMVVHLTADGGRLVRRLFPGHARTMATLFDALSDQEQRTLARLARRLAERAQQHAAATTKGL